MTILYVYAHPNPASFNSKLKSTALSELKQLGCDVAISDLYANAFNAVASWDDFTVDERTLNPQYFLAQQDAYLKQALTADITEEIHKIAWADHLILQFPLWWFSTPAVLKGWLDRVFVKGFAYDTGKVFQDGLLKGKTASLVVTTQSPETAYQTAGAHQATIDTFLHHIHHTLRFVGIKIMTPFVAYAAFNIDISREKQIITDYKAYLQTLAKWDIR